MKIIIGGRTYTELKELNFAPQADLLGQSVPVNEFSVDIKTDDTASIGQIAELRDDLNKLWARYWISFAEQIDEQTLRVVAKSLLTLLDQVTLPAVMYDEEPVPEVLIDVFANTGAALGVYEYELDARFSASTVTGYCPEQTARERLLWVCFSIGAYVRSYFSEKILILPIDNTETLIPFDKTFWKAHVNFGDHVTEIKAKYYSFADDEPLTTDEWVKDDAGKAYVVTKQEMSLKNDAAPAAAPNNVTTIEGVYLLNEGNVSEVLTYLSTLHFKRTTVEVDVVNSGEYIPGDRVIVYAGPSGMMVGYIESATFFVGVQSRTRLKLIGAESVEVADLVVSYMFGDLLIDRKVFLFPVGYTYSLKNPYIDKTLNDHRVIFEPTSDVLTGKMAEEGNSAVVQYERALDHERPTRTLEALSVDEALAEEDDGRTVVVFDY